MIKERRREKYCINLFLVFKLGFRTLTEANKLKSLDVIVGFYFKQKIKQDKNTKRKTFKFSFNVERHVAGIDKDGVQYSYCGNLGIVHGTVTAGSVKSQATVWIKLQYRP